MSAYIQSSDRDIRNCVYIITHKDSRKSYIGKTSRPALERWREHISVAGRTHIKSSNTPLSNALRKYGYEAFEFSVLDIAENEESLNHKERFWISQMSTISPNGYNLTAGGNDHFTHAEETKRRMGEISRNMHATADKSTWRTRKGQKASPDTIEKMRKAHDGRESYYRRVVTRNDGVIFNSLDQAAKASGTNKPNIVAQIKGSKRICNGYQFQYGEVPAWEIPEKGVNPKAKAVIRSDGVVFESLTIAALESNVHQANITKVLLGSRKTTGGYSFKYYEEKEH